MAVNFWVWYNSWYPLTAKPIKTLEMHYLIIHLYKRSYNYFQILPSSLKCLLCASIFAITSWHFLLLLSNESRWSGIGLNTSGCQSTIQLDDWRWSNCFKVKLVFALLYCVLRRHTLHHIYPLYPNVQMDNSKLTKHPSRGE